MKTTIPAKLQEIFRIDAGKIENIIHLIDDGNTIPFIARYRKEMTGNLDDQVLRELDLKLKSLRALEERRLQVLRLIDEQGKLSESLRRQLDAAATLTEIEDLYRPFRPKRKTRGLMAKNRGLQPLADALVDSDMTMPACLKLAEKLAAAHAELDDAQAALAGAQDILAEAASDDADLRRKLRSLYLQEAVICSQGSDPDHPKAAVYADYQDHEEPVSKIRGHRVLAINRGEREDFLKVQVKVDGDQAKHLLLKSFPALPPDRQDFLAQVAADAFKRLLAPSMTTQIRSHLTEKAEDGAMEVFAANLRSLLMQPPVQGHTVMGIDPGYRTGCKIAVIDATGKALDTAVIFPTPPQNRQAEAEKTVHRLISKHDVTLLAIGNGTASRETERFAAQTIRQEDKKIAYLIVNEAGASVYSASPLAAAEFPDYDVSLRSAVSIARRVQDPLAELVKIEPRSIGVGQYQHDMSQKKLDQVLKGVVEACVNEVGVDLNTASAALLTYVSGLNATVAENIVEHRRQNGPFTSRQQLLAVKRMGPKAYEQSAGFLRIPGAKEPLDNTSIHPESYAKVYALSQLLDQEPSPQLALEAEKRPLGQLAEALSIGQPTLKDILAALRRPGRDPRDDLPPPAMRQDVLEMADLKPGMNLGGVVRNVADFGAFVDIGVHQDGLVHISQLADRFVQKPMDIVRVGQEVNVKVLSVDMDRQRIALSMKGIRQPGTKEG